MILSWAACGLCAQAKAVVGWRVSGLVVVGAVALPEAASELRGGWGERGGRSKMIDIIGKTQH